MGLPFLPAGHRIVAHALELVCRFDWGAGRVCIARSFGGSTRAALIGNTVEISGPCCRFPDVAYGSRDGRYLVVWKDYSVSGVYGRLVTDAGTVSGAAFPISEASYGALFPAVAFNAANNEFLVTWDDAGDCGGVIFGQRVRGSDGALLGTNFPIGTSHRGIRSAVAWCPVNNVYPVACRGSNGGVIDVSSACPPVSGTTARRVQFEQHLTCDP
jgi:hypothetical protein